MLGPNAQGEGGAATVKLRLVNKQYAVTRGLVAGDRFLRCDRARHEALQRAGQLTNFRVARHPGVCAIDSQKPTYQY